MLAVSYEALFYFKGTRFLDVIAAGVASVGLMAVSYHFSDGTILGAVSYTHLYVAGGNVYFDTSKLDDYYVFSSQSEKELLVGVRDDVEDVYKRQVILWKISMRRSSHRNQRCVHISNRWRRILQQHLKYQKIRSM